ncbi:glycine betaine ABC transporter substrate-binding protein [Mycobacterium sp. MYCO198283]|nr:glycine betaine ABC transporter substrate-binding protein [Mycobacterium sp. MYCO198283]MCG5433138.1 glycine betaine ABC transporter substrate-binding protein [Mycobacterium sp. MYCO198283]
MSVAVVAAGLTGCGLQSASGTVLSAKPGLIQHYDSLEGVEITVAGKDFTEQLILGNMLSIILKVAGADVTNLSNIPGSFGVREAMLSGRANVSPEYTGTGWINYLGNEQPVKGAAEQWRAVDEADRPNGLTWLPPAPMNNTYSFAIRESEGARLGVTKLSDLQRLSRQDRTFCIESEFANRNDGLIPMLATYGLRREDLGRVTNLDTGVIYTATANGDCNFGEIFTTDGRIPALHLRVLDDDRSFFPLYNLTEVVNTKLLEAHPELAEIFGQLNPRITNEVMLGLNAKVDNDGDDPALVARDWLLREGFVT